MSRIGATPPNMEPSRRFWYSVSSNSEIGAPKSVDGPSEVTTHVPALRIAVKAWRTW